ncbi:MBL fold metallo-hydrolase [Actinoplanes sp. NPDC051475]|uniref:MBL fold metallo-hydrolase n=1 Tax=Actinoplanes sp. NPDC051475 TaxID=3157225 RepID=UPI00344BFA87
MANDDRPVQCTFFGTTSVFVSDATAGIFTDAFLSRPPLLRVALGRIAPDRGRISQALARGHVERLDGIFVAHSHYDHALDAPEVIRQLGGTLYGSESTLNVGRGAGLGEDSLQRIADGDEHTVGDFGVRVFEGLHSPGNRYPGTIDEPLTTPARASSYRDGGCYSFHIAHPTGSVFIHPSANFVPDKFKGVQADVLYLGIGALGAQPEHFREGYWHHVVEAISPKLIIPVHWDNFMHPLTKKLRPMPAFMDRLTDTKDFLDRKSAEGGWTVRFQDPFETITPFVP